MRGLNLYFTSESLIAFLGLLIISSMIGCSTFGKVDPASPLACIPREGNCFEVKIDATRVVPISKKTREFLATVKEAMPATTRADIDSTIWQVESPISGNMDISANFNERGSIWFGQGTGYSQPIITPLAGQKLTYSSRIVSSAPGDPRGVALLQKRVTNRTLPTGPYLVIVSYGGSKNWDRKYIFVQVK